MTPAPPRGLPGLRAQAGERLAVSQLADALLDASVVRAAELDIDPNRWPARCTGTAVGTWWRRGYPGEQLLRRTCTRAVEVKVTHSGLMSSSVARTTVAPWRIWARL